MFEVWVHTSSATRAKNIFLVCRQKTQYYYYQIHVSMRITVTWVAKRGREHVFSQIEIEEHMNRYELNIRVHRSFTYTILRSRCEFCSLALLCLCVSIASSNKLSLSADGIASYRFAFQNYFNRFGISDFFSAYAIRSSISIMAHIQHKEWILKWWLL